MVRVRTGLGREGFSLVELMAVVAIIGVLAALAVYGVRHHLSYAKTAEARTVVGQIAKGAKAAFERETTKGAVVAGGETSPILHTLCTNADHPVPSDIRAVAAKKYQSSLAEWEASRDPRAGFSCLGFAMSEPQYFQYDYQSTSGEQGTFSAFAHGDLDGDGTTSTFALHGSVLNGALFVAPAIDESNPEE